MRKKQARKYSGFVRSDRVSAAIQRILATAVVYELRDPRLSMISITGVEMSPDNRSAKIYFSLIGGPGAVKAALAGFNAAAGVFKRKIADELRLQHTPELRFFHDKSMAYAQEMDELFRSLKTESAESSEAAADDRSEKTENEDDNES